MRNLRVLIFSASFGAGHTRAADAIIEALRQKEPSAEINHVDFGALLSKSMNYLIKASYIQLLKHTPKIWGKLYYRNANASRQSLLQRCLNQLGYGEFLKFINAMQPDLIICTYPNAAGILSYLKLKGFLDIPLVTVVTDYAVHSQWIHPGVDLYLVGHKDIGQGLVSRGIKPERVKVTGIPVSPRFESPIDRGVVISRLGLKADRTTVLVMGGAYGVLHNAEQVCKILADTDLPVQTLVVCGQDGKLYKSLEHLAAGARNPMVRFGFVDNVEELMAAADLVITKAGGLTVTEALTMRLPLIIVNSIPGQEEENISFLYKVGAGRVANSPEEVEQILRTVLQHPAEMHEMRRAAALAIPKGSADRAVEQIMGLIRTVSRNGGLDHTVKTGMALLSYN